MCLYNAQHNEKFLTLKVDYFDGGCSWSKTPRQYLTKIIHMHQYISPYKVEIILTKTTLQVES